MPVGAPTPLPRAERPTGSSPLVRKAKWLIHPGASGAPLVRWLGAGAILLSVAVTLAWCATWLWDATAAGTSPGLLALVVGLTSLVVWQAFALWRHWVPARTPITLLWEGLPARDAQATTLSPASSDRRRAARTGWWVSPWRLPVRVVLVVDLQRWLLIRLVLPDGAQRPRVCWAWLDLARMAHAHTASRAHWSDVHALRLRLHLPAFEPDAPYPEHLALPTQSRKGRKAAVAAAADSMVASSLRGNALPSSAKQASNAVRLRALGASARRGAVHDSGWPSTLAAARDPRGSRDDT